MLIRIYRIQGLVTQFISLYHYSYKISFTFCMRPGSTLGLQAVVSDQEIGQPASEDSAHATGVDMFDRQTEVKTNENNMRGRSTSEDNWSNPTVMSQLISTWGVSSMSHHIPFREPLPFSNQKKSHHRNIFPVKRQSTGVKNCLGALQIIIVWIS